MQFKLSFVALVGVVSSLVGATALPAPEPEPVEVEARAGDSAQYDGYLFVCTAYDWEGSCINIGFYSQSCQNFPSGYDNAISSVGPTQGWNCHLLIDYNCNADQGDYWVEYPGFSELTYGNDQFSSFECYRT
ncbi:hypothetical protein NM688_g51 [Phlebia brevispora]|uniref:Uncharacterized protein n=1 Tax=Phlebia brevispora TaxID=194682 RepID=A0ACC1TF33_9APHY|nr:hypothetical protein NM688_g51 [Phlebia brevispora]